MMRVDQTGQHDMSREIENFVGGVRQFGRRAELRDPVTTHEDGTIGYFTAGIVHGNQYRGMPNQ